MSAAPLTAVLTCKRGALAGSTFELTAMTFIGRDAAGRIVVTSGSDVHTCDARIFMKDGARFIENLGEPGHVLLDGSTVRGAVLLSRLHVIELSDATFMYSQRAASVATTRNAGASATSSVGLGTTIDDGGFDPLPTFGANTQVGHGTVVDPGAFDAMPSLERRIDPVSPPLSPSPTSLPPTSLPPDDGQTRVYEPPPKDSPFVLLITLSNLGLTTFPLKYGDNVIGRGEGCDIRLHDPQKWLSRKHAVLKIVDERVELVDLQGSNGTFVLGARVTTAILISGMHFTLGPQFEFSLEKR